MDGVGLVYEAVPFKFRPENPEWNDSVAFSSFYLMDDQVLVETDVGQRTFESNRVAIEAMTLLLGPNASNAKKDLEEGAWERRKLIWGLQYDTDLTQLSLPGPKLEKAHFLFSLSEFDYGAEPPPMRLIQELRGNQQFWLCVMPELAPYLGANDALLARTDAKGRACPKGSPSQQRCSWQDFWEAVELQRVLVTARPQWATRFTNSLTGALTTSERLALPGAAARVVWVTGDATLERIACIDWTHRIALVGTVEPYHESPRKLATASEEGVPPDEEVIIAIAELITYLALASASAETWQDRLVLYTGDNMNGHQWLESRAAGNALARWLLRILGALEATHSFQTISAYFRTYHNVTADSLTRDKCGEVDELLQRHGLELLDAKPDWALHVDRDWTRRVLAWHGQDRGDHQVALQLAERRQGRSLPATPTPLPVPRPGERFHALEWRVTLGTYAVAALGQGVHGSLVPLKGGPRLESSIWPPTIKRSREQEARAVDCFLASFTEDPSGEEARRFALVLSKTGARVFWVDAPAKANLQPLTSLRSEGWKVAELDVDFGELGEPTNTQRRVVAACRDDFEPWALDDLESLRAPPRESSWLEKAKVIPDNVWITGDREFFTGNILPSPIVATLQAAISSRSVALRKAPKDNTISILRSSSPCSASPLGKLGMKHCFSPRRGRCAASNPSKSGGSRGALRRRGGQPWRRATLPTSWLLGRLGPHPRELPQSARLGVSVRSAIRPSLTRASGVLASARYRRRGSVGRLEGMAGGSSGCRPHPASRRTEEA